MLFRDAECYSEMCYILTDAMCYSGDSALQEAVLSVMPLVSGANDMAEDIQKPVKFEIVLVSAEARGLEDGRTEVSDGSKDTLLR